MFAQLLCACPIYTSHRHAHAIALHMRKPLLCTCAPHYTAHVHNSQTCLLDGWIGLDLLVGCHRSRDCPMAQTLLKLKIHVYMLQVIKHPIHFQQQVSLGNLTSQL